MERFTGIYQKLPRVGHSDDLKILREWPENLWSHGTEWMIARARFYMNAGAGLWSDYVSLGPQNRKAAEPFDGLFPKRKIMGLVPEWMLNCKNRWHDECMIKWHRIFVESTAVWSESADGKTDIFIWKFWDSLILSNTNARMNNLQHYYI